MAECHLSWDSYKKNICNGFARLQRSEEFVDMTLAADGYLVQVHKSLIALASPYIMRMLKMAPCANPVVFLNGVHYDVLTYLLEFIYTGEVRVPTDRMNDFLQQAKALHIIGVENVIAPMHARQHLKNRIRNSETVEHRVRDFNEGENSQTMRHNSNSEQPHPIIEQHTQNDSTGPVQSHSEIENSLTMPHNINSEQPHFIIELHNQNVSTGPVESHYAMESSQARPQNSNSEQPHFIIKQCKQNDSTAPVESHSEIENSQTRPQNSNMEQPHFIIELNNQKDSTGRVKSHSEMENIQTRPQNSNSKQPHFVIKQCKLNDSTATVESHSERDKKSIKTNTIDMTKNSIAVKDEAMDTNYEPVNDIIDLVSDVCIENVNSSTAILNTVQSDQEAIKYELETLVSITSLSDNAKYQSDCSVFDNNDPCTTNTEVNDNIIPFEEPQCNAINGNENVENVMDENNTNVVPQPPNYKIELKLLTEDGQTKPQLITSFNPSSEPVQGSSKEQTVFPIYEFDKNDTAIYYMVTFRNRLMAILNRYMYYSHHSSHNGRRRRWRCIDYRHKGCKAFLDTEGEYIIKRRFIHNHDFHDLKIMKRAENNQNRMFTTIASALAASATALSDHPMGKMLLQ